MERFREVQRRQASSASTDPILGDGPSLIRFPAGGAILLVQSVATLDTCTFVGCTATASGDNSAAVRAARRPLARREAARCGVRASQLPE